MAGLFIAMLYTAFEELAPRIPDRYKNPVLMLHIDGRGGLVVDDTENPEHGAGFIATWDTLKDGWLTLKRHPLMDEKANGADGP